MKGVVESSEVVILGSQPHGEDGFLSHVYSNQRGLLTLFVQRRWGEHRGLERPSALFIPLNILDVNYQHPRGADGVAFVESVECVHFAKTHSKGKALVQQLVCDLLYQVVRLGGSGLALEDLYNFIRLTATRYHDLSVAEYRYFPSVMLLGLMCELGYTPRGDYSLLTPCLNLELGYFQEPPSRTELIRRGDIYLSDSDSFSFHKMLTFGYRSMVGLGDAANLLYAVKRYTEIHLQTKLKSSLLQAFVLLMCREE